MIAYNALLVTPGEQCRLIEETLYRRPKKPLLPWQRAESLTLFVARTDPCISELLDDNLAFVPGVGCAVVYWSSVNATREV